MEKTALDYTKPTSEAEAIRVLDSISRYPLASPLVKLFERASNPRTYRLSDWGYPEIFGDSKEREIKLSLRLTQQHDYVELNFLGMPIKRIPHPSKITGSDRMIEIFARPRGIDNESYGRGNKNVYAIMIRFNKRLILPSRKARYIFNLMNWFSSIVAEFCESSS